MKDLGRNCSDGDCRHTTFSLKRDFSVRPRSELDHPPTLVNPPSHHCFDASVAALIISITSVYLTALFDRSFLSTLSIHSFPTLPAPSAYLLIFNDFAPPTFHHDPILFQHALREPHTPLRQPCLRLCHNYHSGGSCLHQWPGSLWQRLLRACGWRRVLLECVNFL